MPQAPFVWSQARSAYTKKTPKPTKRWSRPVLTFIPISIFELTNGFGGPNCLCLPSSALHNMGTGQNIKALRKRDQLTQEEFAALIGVSKETVCRGKRTAIQSAAQRCSR